MEMFIIYVYLLILYKKKQQQQQQRFVPIRTQISSQTTAAGATHFRENAGL